jgi:hypothetical protein
VVAGLCGLFLIVWWYCDGIANREREAVRIYSIGGSWLQQMQISKQMAGIKYQVYSDPTCNMKKAN